LTALHAQGGGGRTAGDESHGRIGVDEGLEMHSQSLRYCTSSNMTQSRAWSGCCCNSTKVCTRLSRERPEYRGVSSDTYRMRVPGTPSSSRSCTRCLSITVLPTRR